ncbi:ATP-binding cassette domain-containing protein [Erysipelothrix piscisicarius]
MAGTSPSLTVLENLSLASNKGKLMSLTKAINHKHEAEFVNLLRSLNLGLEDKLHVKVGQLSGGQRQALSLLMALMNNPDLLLLDEHTAALDPKSSESIIKLTQNMVAERNITTIMVTHNLQHALDYGSRLLMFHNGNIIRDISSSRKGEPHKKRFVEKCLRLMMMLILKHFKAEMPFLTYSSLITGLPIYKEEKIYDS